MKDGESEKKPENMTLDEYAKYLVEKGKSLRPQDREMVDAQDFLLRKEYRGLSDIDRTKAFMGLDEDKQDAVSRGSDSTFGMIASKREKGIGISEKNTKAGLNSYNIGSYTDESTDSGSRISFTIGKERFQNFLANGQVDFLKKLNSAGFNGNVSLNTDPLRSYTNTNSFTFQGKSDEDMKKARKVANDLFGSEVEDIRDESSFANIKLLADAVNYQLGFEDSKKNILEAGYNPNTSFQDLVDDLGLAEGNTSDIIPESKLVASIKSKPILPELKPVNDYSKLNQIAYVKHLASHANEKIGYYDVVARPEFRGEFGFDEAKEREYLKTIPLDKGLKYEEGVEDLYYKMMQEVSNDIKPSWHNSVWYGYDINNKDGKVRQGDSVYKSYVNLKLGQELLSPEDQKGFMSALQESGYRGSIKFSKNPQRVIRGFDNIVMHGKTAKDALMVQKVARDYFGDKMAGFDVGVDKYAENGKGFSSSQILQVAANYKIAKRIGEGAFEEGTVLSMVGLTPDAAYQIKDDAFDPIARSTTAKSPRHEKGDSGVDLVGGNDLVKGTVESKPVVDGGESQDSAAGIGTIASKPVGGKQTTDSTDLPSGKTDKSLSEWMAYVAENGDKDGKGIFTSYLTENFGQDKANDIIKGYFEKGMVSPKTMSMDFLNRLREENGGRYESEDKISELRKVIPSIFNQTNPTKGIGEALDSMLPRNHRNLSIRGMFSRASENVHPNVLGRIFQGVQQFKSVPLVTKQKTYNGVFENARRNLGRGDVHANKDDSWSDTPQTIAHEAGHGAFVTHFDELENGPDGNAPIKSIIEAAKKDVANLLTPATYNKLHDLILENNEDTRDVVGKVFYGRSLADSPISAQKNIAAFTDILQASGAADEFEFFGHDSAYYDDKKFGMESRADEMTANITDALINGDETILKSFPNLVQAVQRDVYGIGIDEQKAFEQKKRDRDSKRLTNANKAFSEYWDKKLGNSNAGNAGKVDSKSTGTDGIQTDIGASGSQTTGSNETGLVPTTRRTDGGGRTGTSEGGALIPISRSLVSLGANRSNRTGNGGALVRSERAVANLGSDVGAYNGTSDANQQDADFEDADFRGDFVYGDNTDDGEVIDLTSRNGQPFQYRRGIFDSIRGAFGRAVGGVKSRKWSFGGAFGGGGGGGGTGGGDGGSGNGPTGGLPTPSPSGDIWGNIASSIAEAFKNSARYMNFFTKELIYGSRAVKDSFGRTITDTSKLLGGAFLGTVKASGDAFRKLTDTTKGGISLFANFGGGAAKFTRDISKGIARALPGGSEMMKSADMFTNLLQGSGSWGKLAAGILGAVHGAMTFVGGMNKNSNAALQDVSKTGRTFEGAGINKNDAQLMMETARANGVSEEEIQGIAVQMQTALQKEKYGPTYMNELGQYGFSIINPETGKVHTASSALAQISDLVNRYEANGMGDTARVLMSEAGITPHMIDFIRNYGAAYRNGPSGDKYFSESHGFDRNLTRQNDATQLALYYRKNKMVADQVSGEFGRMYSTELEKRPWKENAAQMYARVQARKGEVADLNNTNYYEATVESATELLPEIGKGIKNEIVEGATALWDIIKVGFSSLQEKALPLAFSCGNAFSKAIKQNFPLLSLLPTSNPIEPGINAEESNVGIASQPVVPQSNGTPPVETKPIVGQQASQNQEAKPVVETKQIVKTNPVETGKTDQVNVPSAQHAGGAIANAVQTANAPAGSAQQTIGANSASGKFATLIPFIPRPTPTSSGPKVLERTPQNTSYERSHSPNGSSFFYNPEMNENEGVPSSKLGGGDIRHFVGANRDIRHLKGVSSDIRSFAGGRSEPARKRVNRKSDAYFARGSGDYGESKYREGEVYYFGDGTQENYEADEGGYGFGNGISSQTKASLEYYRNRHRLTNKSDYDSGWFRKTLKGDHSEDIGSIVYSGGDSYRKTIAKKDKNALDPYAISTSLLTGETEELYGNGMKIHRKTNGDVIAAKSNYISGLRREFAESEIVNAASAKAIKEEDEKGLQRHDDSMTQEVNGSFYYFDSYVDQKTGEKKRGGILSIQDKSKITKELNRPILKLSEEQEKQFKESSFSNENTSYDEEYNEDDARWAWLKYSEMSDARKTEYDRYDDEESLKFGAPRSLKNDLAKLEAIGERRNDDVLNFELTKRDEKKFRKSEFSKDNIPSHIKDYDADKARWMYLQHKGMDDAQKKEWDEFTTNSFGYNSFSDAFKKMQEITGVKSSEKYVSPSSRIFNEQMDVLKSRDAQEVESKWIRGLKEGDVGYDTYQKNKKIWDIKTRSKDKFGLYDWDKVKAEYDSAGIDMTKERFNDPGLYTSLRDETLKAMGVSYDAQKDELTYYGKGKTHSFAQTNPIRKIYRSKENAWMHGLKEGDAGYDTYQKNKRIWQIKKDSNGDWDKAKESYKSWGINMSEAEFDKLDPEKLRQQVLDEMGVKYDEKRDRLTYSNEKDGINKTFSRRDKFRSVENDLMRGLKEGDGGYDTYQKNKKIWDIKKYYGNNWNMASQALKNAGIVLDEDQYKNKTSAESLRNAVINEMGITYESPDERTGEEYIKYKGKRYGARRPGTSSRRTFKAERINYSRPVSDQSNEAVESMRNVSSRTSQAAASGNDYMSANGARAFAGQFNTASSSAAPGGETSKTINLTVNVNGMTFHVNDVKDLQDAWNRAGQRVMANQVALSTTNG